MSKGCLKIPTIMPVQVAAFASGGHAALARIGVPQGLNSDASNRRAKNTQHDTTKNGDEPPRLAYVLPLPTSFTEHSPTRAMHTYIAEGTAAICTD